MQKRIRILLSLILALAIISSAVIGVVAAEMEQGQEQEQSQEPEQPQEPEHIHNWRIQLTRPKGHTWVCNDCGESKLEAHTVDSTETCTVCGYHGHTHDWYCESANVAFHTMVCRGCGESSTTTHILDSDERCTICGYKERVHEHIWQYDGNPYDYSHGLCCTLCDASITENHIYGNDGTCTVCGQAAPHEHQWKWNGEQHLDRYHVLGCTCGETKTEEHQLVWDGKNRDSKWHTVVCVVCGQTRTHGHWYSTVYVNGTRCVECGYETVKHTWQYSDYFDEDGHDMICSHCDSHRFEGHKANSSGKCSVCGYHVNDATKSETKPTEAKAETTSPTEAQSIATESAETKTEETEPTEIKAKATNPTEAKPIETNPAETKPVEAKPAETKPAASETMPENATQEDPQRSSTAGVWYAVVIVVASGLVAAVLFLKQKLS